MRNTLVAALLAAVLPWASGPAANGSAHHSAVQAALANAPATVRVWDGRNAEFETFITTAPVERFADIPVGVTRPRRAFFKQGGLAESVAWKVLPPRRVNGYWESYKSEIAAYELDKVLGMGMVPVAVEKRWKHEIAAAILWLSPVRSWKDVQWQPKPEKWDRQMDIMKMFDNLISNKDRNLGNLLVDEDWNVFLIDHSRAFIEGKQLPARMTHVNRELWNRMLSLDEPTLATALGKWVDGRARRALLARRDKMKELIDEMVRASGEDAVFRH